MCNMAAYVGNEPAAPVLLRLIRNQEGLGCGHFTGLATIHEGKLYYAKVCGDLERLLKTTNAAELPGTIGIVHSRTPGDPYDAWAHPFISSDESVAYTANGAQGVFENTVDYDVIHKRLTAAGDFFRTEIHNPDIKNKPRLYNGNNLHISDLMCGFIAEGHLRMGLDLASAMRRAYSEAPSELAGLCVSLREPDTVTACRLNQPLMWGRKEGAGYLATSAIGFKDENLEGVHAVPAGVSVVLGRNCIQITPFSGRLGHVYTVIPWGQAAEVMDKFMADGEPHHIGSIANAIKGLWPGDCLDESVMLAYQYAHEMVAIGRFEIVTKKVPASLPGAQTIQKLFKLK